MLIGLDDLRVPGTLYTTEYVSLRALLRAARDKAGLTQVGLAERLGVGQSYISKIERGESFVDVVLFVRWCEACGARPARLLNSMLRTPS